MELGGKKVGVNDPCPCGARLKYKKCCLERNRKEGITVRFIPRESMNGPMKELEDRVERQHAFRKPFLQEQGYYLRHIQVYSKSHGKRLRAIFDRKFFREPQETFHEYLVQCLIMAMSLDWWKVQEALKPEEQHYIFQQYIKYAEWKKKNANEDEKMRTGRYFAFPDGHTQWLLCLAYDLYSLMHTNYLIEPVLEKLRANNEGFQGARYEIAVAAIFARANFQIDHYDETDPQVVAKKHGEFIATDRDSGEKIVVEAKSKRRAGVLGFKGAPQDEKRQLKGDFQRLLKDAMEKETEGLPYMIFIDLNSPQTPNIAIENKPWWKDILRIAKDHLEPEGEPQKANCVSITNWSYHYQGENQATGGETVHSIALNPQHPLGEAIRDKLVHVCDRYGHVPDLDEITQIADALFEKVEARRTAQET